MHRLEENEMNAKNLKTDDKIFFRGIYQINQPRLFLRFAAIQMKPCHQKIFKEQNTQF